MRSFAPIELRNPFRPTTVESVGRFDLPTQPVRRIVRFIFRYRERLTAGCRAAWYCARRSMPMRLGAAVTRLPVRSVDGSP